MKRNNIVLIICILLLSISCKEKESKSREEIIKDSIEHAKLKEEVLNDKIEREEELEEVSLMAYDDLMFLMSIEEVRQIDKYKNNSMEIDGENPLYTNLKLSPNLIPIDNIEKFTAIFYKNKLNIIKVESKDFYKSDWNSEIPKTIKELKELIGEARTGNFKEYGIPKPFELVPDKYMTVYKWEFKEKVIEIKLGEISEGGKYKVICESSNYLAQTDISGNEE